MGIWLQNLQLASMHVQLRQGEEGSAPEDLLVKTFATYQLAPKSELQATFLNIAHKSSRIDASEQIISGEYKLQ